MAAYGDFGDERIKHLELIQAVIARLGSNGFLVKGSAVTITTALIGLAVNSDDAGLALAALVPALAFWGLDTYFLRAERLFRELYEYVREDRGVEPFFMGATTEKFIGLLPGGSGKRVASKWRTALRPTLVIFYLALAGAAVLSAILIC